MTILGAPIPPATADADAFYLFPSVPEGAFWARAEAGRCTEPQTQPLVVSGGPVTLDFALDRAGPPDAGFVQGRVADRNDGLGVAQATVRALQDGAEARTHHDRLRRLVPPRAEPRHLRRRGASRHGTEAGQAVVEAVGDLVVRDFSLLLASDSGRQPFLFVPVRLVVPAFDQPPNAGGGAHVDGESDAWAADQPFDGRWGFTRSSSTATTTAEIAGTDDDPLVSAIRVTHRPDR